MKQFNLHEFYNFGYVLHPLSELQPGKPFGDYYFSLVHAGILLDKFVNNQMIPMTICTASARKIIGAIDRLVSSRREEEGKLDTSKAMTDFEVFQIIEGVKEFETVFSAEVQNMATYFVSKKGIYDTNDLISHAEDMFPSGVKECISEQAQTDIRESGRCLAFDLATATGFHVARAVEGVLLDYLTLLCPSVVANLKENQRNLGSYIKLARENKGDEKVCNSLDQFRDLHRNPLIHPEAVLTIDDAVALLGIAQSAIISLALQIAKLKGQPAPLGIAGG